MRISAKLIDAAVAALTEVMRFEHPADAVLSQFFREQRVMGQRDRGFVAETVYAVLRRRRYLERLVAPDLAPRRLALAALLRVQGVSQRQLAAAVSAEEAAWLTEQKAEAELSLTLAEQADLPDWLAERLLQRMSADQLLELARGLNQGAPLDVRVNPLKATREDVLLKLNADGIEAQACPYSPLAIRLKRKPALQRNPLYLSGAIEVQDEGSQLLAYLLAPRRGEMVVDFCAGAGGKTLLLGALMRSTGRLYAFDVAEKRLSRLRTRVARSGLSNVHPICINSENDVRVKRLTEKIDRVLVDAPCSGLGTLRRNPDLKWRQTPEGVAELARKQASILSGAARLVKPKGRLVYATCSILPEENEEIIAGFLETHPQFRLVSAADVLKKQRIELECGEIFRLTPHQHNTDGFYAVVLDRAA
jgi:16S rRNA (cytosine967-C5)-methyltransferase